MSALSHPPASEGAGESRAPRRALIARLVPHATVAVATLTIALIWTGVFVNITRERMREAHNAFTTTSNLARAFEEQIIGSLRAADQVLLHFRSSYEKTGGLVDPSLWLRPYDALGELSFQIAIIGADGWLVASNIETSHRVNLSDREHFKVHAARSFDELFISKPVVGRVSGRESIQLTRRISAADGGFGGVIVLSVDPNYFTRFYRTIDLGKRGSISLIGTDGIIRAHGVNPRVSNGQSIVGGHLMEAFARNPIGNFAGPSRSDGVERYVTYRAVGGYPLLVAVDLAVDEVLADYYRTRLLRILAAIALTAILVPVAVVVVRYQRSLARARDAAEAAARARTEFLAVMSHEIRTPMNAVLGFASTLLESKLDAEQRQNATALHAAGDDLLRLLNDILDFSRLDAGRIAFEDIPFSPAAVVDTTVGIASRAASAKGIALRVEIEPSVPLALRGDAGRLRQVLLNLLTNAIKFTSRGEVVVRLRQIAGSTTNAEMEWSVADTGVGIAADRIDSVFADFVQADSSVNRRFGGSGLGLAICARIIAQMKGRIGVTSVVGQGSTFTFNVTLPLCDLDTVADTNAGTAIEDLTAHIAALGRPLRILLAEDNPTNQLVGKQMLSAFDSAVSIASNGTEAVQSAMAFAYDVILMDIQMPEMNGIEATRAIRARGGARAGVPIVALTANAYPEDVKACLAAGMNDFVAKPVRKSALADAILRSLSGTKRTQAAVSTQAKNSETDLPLLDRTMIDEFVEDVGVTAMGPLLATFVSETERRLGLLRNLTTDEPDAIHLEAHTLKGSSGLFGLMRFSAVARDIERASRTISPNELVQARERLEHVFAQSRVALSEYERSLDPTGATASE